MLPGVWPPGPAGRVALAQTPATTLVDDVVAANRILAAERVLDGDGPISARHATNPDR